MHIFSIAEVCERALRKIGAFAIRSSGARQEEMDEARYWLDMIVTHQTSRMRTWWMVPASATFNLTPGVSTYDLNAALGTAQVPNGIQFVIDCILFNSSTGLDIHHISSLRRQEWEMRSLTPIALPDGDYSAVDQWTEDDAYWGGSNSAVSPIQPGPPAICYIDRAQRPTMYLSPTPDTLTPYGVRVLFQSYADDFVNAKPESRQYRFRASWNLWMVTALAAQLADGPVRKLPADEVGSMKKDAEKYRNELEAYEADEHANDPQRVAYSDF
jgi:hypothetical protein